MALLQDKKSFFSSYFCRLKKNYRRHRSIYLLALPIVTFYVLFKYIPMAGIVIAFQDFSPAKGLWNSSFVGFSNFIDFFHNPTSLRTVRNTVTLNLYQLLVAFPAPIILALSLNELRSQWYKRFVQTLSYIPHFISLVVVCGILKDFCASTGIFNDIAETFGFTRQNLLANVDIYRPVYIGSGIWQSVGWGSVLYLATLSSADPNLYEAAVIDGAGRFKQLIHITIPVILPIMMLQFILGIGSLMSEGAEKTILLYSPLVYEKADIISSLVYRIGLQRRAYSYGAAVGLFNSVINLCLLAAANKLSDRIVHESMW